MIFSPYDNASSGDESIGFLVFAISLFTIILPSATIQPFNVGYQDVGLTANQQVIKGLLFKNTTASTIKLSEIKMVEAMSDGSTMIRWMNSDGTYSTANWTYMADKDYAEFGWGDPMNFTRTEVEFKPGQAFFITPGQLVGDVSIHFAGQLYTSDAALARIGVELTANLQELVTNPMPNNGYKLSDIEMMEAMSDGSTMIRWMNSDGTYSTANWTYMADKDYAEFGWGDPMNFTRAADRDFSAGEGFFITPGQLVGDVSITFPNPLN